MAEPTSPPLSGDDIERLIDAFAAWVERHSYPDYRAFAFGSSEPFSPRELLFDLRQGGPIGDQVLRMVRFATEVEPLDAIIAGLRGDERLRLA
jgi:hypothetical protein